MRLAVFPNDPIRAYLRTYGKDFKVKYFNPLNFFDEVHIISPFEEDSYRLANNICVHGIAGVFSSIPLLSLLFHVIKATAIVKKFHVDLIRSYNPLLAGLTALVTGKLMKRPIVVSVHTDYHMTRRFMEAPALVWVLLVAIEKFVLRYSNGVVCKSGYLKNYVISLENRLQNVVVIPNFVETDLFSPRDGLEVKRKLGIEGKHVVLYVGRLESEKNVLEVIKSEAKVIEKIPETIFVYVGDGKQKNELIALTKKNRIGENTIFVGEKSHADVAKFMAAADVVVCPYSGFVLLEAMSSAKPVVAPDIEWHSEVVKHMQTGILVKPACSKKGLPEKTGVGSIFEGLIWVLSHPSQARALGKNAREMMLSRFSYEALSEMEIDFYKEAMSKSKRSV